MRRMKHRAMVLAALLLAGAVAACGGDDDSDAFTFTEDELCDWITADEVAGFYASVYEWDGTAELVNTEDAGPDECWWRPPALSEGVVVQSAGWGAYSFWAPPRDEHLSLLANRVSVDGPGTRVVGVGDRR